MARRRGTCEVPQHVGDLVFETGRRVETEKLLFSEGDQSLRDDIGSAVAGSACQNSGIGVAVKDLSNGLDNRDGLSRAWPKLPIKQEFPGPQKRRNSRPEHNERQRSRRQAHDRAHGLKLRGVVGNEWVVNVDACAGVALQQDIGHSRK